jgi:hypothetical protein
MFRFRFAEKLRLSAEVAWWTGHGPRTGSPEHSQGTKPSQSRTSARATLARTSANRMAGMAVLPEIETDSDTGPQPTRHQPGAVLETEKRNP